MVSTGDWVVRDGQRAYAVRSFAFRGHCRGVPGEPPSAMSTRPHNSPIRPSWSHVNLERSYAGRGTGLGTTASSLVSRATTLVSWPPCPPEAYARTYANE